MSGLASELAMPTKFSMLFCIIHSRQCRYMSGTTLEPRTLRSATTRDGSARLSAFLACGATRDRTSAQPNVSASSFSKLPFTMRVDATGLPRCRTSTWPVESNRSWSSRNSSPTMQ
jgi:hypothetical protein